MYQPLFVRPISGEEKEALARNTASRVREEASRAEVILLSTQGKTIAEISESLGFHPSNIKKWIRRFNEQGLAGISVKKRGPLGGPRPRFTRVQVQEIIRLSETDPLAQGLKFKQWTPQKLASAAVKRGIVERISHVTVRQILKQQEQSRQQVLSQAVGNPSASPQDTFMTQKATSFSPDPSPPGAHLQLGKEALERSEYERAQQHLRAALAAQPLGVEEDAAVRSLLSQALEELSRYEEAYEALRVFEDGRLLSQLTQGMRARVKLRLGWANSWLRNYPEAIAALNDAKKLYLEQQHDQGVCEAYYALGRTYIEINEYRIARDHLLAAAKFEGRIFNFELLAQIYSRLGTVDFYEGAFSNSKENYLKALKLAEGSSNSNLTGMILLNLGTAFIDVAEQSEAGRHSNLATEYLERAVTHLEKGGHRDNLALAYNNLGENYWLAGRWDRAMDNLQRAIAVTKSHVQPHYEATSRITLAEILCARGAFEEAETHLKQSLSLIGNGIDKWLESNTLRILAIVNKGLARYEEVSRLLRDALQLSISIGDLQGVALAQLALAAFYYEQGKNDQAKEYIELAQGRLKEEKSLVTSGLIQRLIGQMEAVKERFAEAKQHIAQSISIFATMDIPFELARSYYQMGLLCKGVSDIPAATTNLHRAREIFAELQATPDLRETEAAVAALQSDGGEAVARATVKPPSDVLLMQRLIEASASSELLVRELVAILHDNFPIAGVFIGRMEESGRVEPLAVQGFGKPELEAVLARLEPALWENGGASGDARILRIGDALKASMGVYVRPLGDLDMGRLQPLLKQAELGLETCSLRVAARRITPVTTEYRIKTVMPGFIIGSQPMFDVIDKIQKIRTSNVTVLITGESGTGKELVARAIHAESARARAIFLPFNCTATPKEIIDSHLFGHRRGAFTGATENYPGIIRAADGGTLFLDEIGDLSLEIQPKLMRFLQESEIQPLGETKPMRVDVRVLAATNSDLERAVEDGRFRTDLFHRLNIIRIHVPPLRDRREEIPFLATHFLEHFSSRSGKQGIRLTQNAIDALTAYDWPGNVRQLRNEIERLVAYSYEEASITAEDLSSEVSHPRKHPARAVGRATDNWEREASTGRRETAEPRFFEPRSTDPAPADGAIVKLKDATAELETRLIKLSLARNKNNLSRTAVELGLSRRGLRLKLIQLGIARE